MTGILFLLIDDEIIFLVLRVLLLSSSHTDILTQRKTNFHSLSYYTWNTIENKSV